MTYNQRMTQIVHLTDEQHARLAAYAKRTGLPVAAALDKLIPKGVQTVKKATKSSLGDDTLPFTPTERRRLKQARLEAARGDTVAGPSFFSSFSKK